MTEPETGPNLTERECGAEEEYDVVVVGAGLSGVGAACHLRRDTPELSVSVLEARDSIGGTWDLFRYPGVRSDSDMFTLGYAFAPWRRLTGIAEGAAIRDYVCETAHAYGVDRLVRFGHRVLAADWSSDSQRWRLTVQHDQQIRTVSARFVSVCSGYYRYDHGHRPRFTGEQDFAGRLIHPQHWPADLDVAATRVVVIGSGATAVTLVPALAAQGAQVSMVQRSPSFIATLPSEDPLARRLFGRLPDRVAARVVRAKNAGMQMLTYALSRRRPEFVRGALRRAAAAQLPDDFDLDTHLSPRYDPWDQRLCVSPDGDLFAAVRAGRAEIVTDAVRRLTPGGVLLASGRELAADVVVTATGLELLVAGGMMLTVDGRDVDVPRTVSYKGMMLSGVPNLALTIGYVNASWTLRADLIATYVTRLLRYLDRHDLGSVTPEPPADLDPAGLRPLIDLQAGYVLRGADRLPRQGPRRPWRMPQNYLIDVLLLRFGRLTDGVRFAAPIEPRTGGSARVRQKATA